MTQEHPGSTPSPFSCGSRAKPWSSSAAATRRSPRRACSASRARDCASWRPTRNLTCSNGLRPTAPNISRPPMRPLIWTARRWSSPPPATKASTAASPKTPAAAGIPVNAVDRPELCDFFTPAIVNRAPLAVAIGTEGAGPVLAQMVRARIDRLLSPSLGPLAVLADSLARGRRAAGAERRARAAASGTTSSPARRRAPWKPATRLAPAARPSRTAVALHRSRKAISRWSAPVRARRIC